MGNDIFRIVLCTHSSLHVELLELVIKAPELFTKLHTNQRGGNASLVGLSLTVDEIDPIIKLALRRRFLFGEQANASLPSYVSCEREVCTPNIVPHRIHSFP